MSVTSILHIFSMRRSGQHGVINWIVENAESAEHYDDCQFLGDKGIIKRAGGRVITKATFQNIKTFRRLLTVVNGEDQQVKDFSNWFPERVPYKQAVLLRDPYNMMASRIKGGHTKIGFPADLEMWKQLAMDALKDNIFIIKFNNWFQNIEYRKTLASTLGFSLPFMDLGLQKVGKGTSSFDGGKFNGKAQEMDVLNRWRQIPQHLWGHFDNETNELCMKHFGFYRNKNRELIVE